MSRARQVDVLLGGALLLAFSPGVYDLVHHWLLHPWSRYSALFVALVGWLAVREGGAKPQRALGIGLIAVAVVLQLLSVLSVMPAIARLAVVGAATGFALLRGLASLRVSTLAVFVVPVPHAVADLLAGTPIARELFRAASRLSQSLGATVAAGNLQVVSGDTILAVDSTQAGLPVLVAMAGLAWYAVLRARLPLRRGLHWLALLLASGAVAHGLGIGLACLALVSGSASAAGFLVDTLGWMVPSAAAVFALERYQRPYAMNDLVRPSTLS